MSWVWSAVVAGAASAGAEMPARAPARVRAERAAMRGERSGGRDRRRDISGSGGVERREAGERSHGGPAFHPAEGDVKGGEGMGRPYSGERPTRLRLGNRA